MTQQEIFEKVTALEKQLEGFDTDIFILNKEVLKLEQQIVALQNQCQHEYENGICKYCHKMEAAQ